MSKHLIVENHLQKILQSSSKVKAYLFRLMHKNSQQAARMGSHSIRRLGKSLFFPITVKVRVLSATQILKLRTFVYFTETIKILLSWLGWSGKIHSSPEMLAWLFPSL